MRKFSTLALTISLLVLCSGGCSTGRVPVAPGTVPREIHVSAEDEAYGHQVLAELSRSNPLSRDDASIQRVRSLVTRLATAAHADKHPWNVFVLEGDNVINAAATRGNYVFVWTGMLRETRNDGELAAVIAHELGHVLANHTKPTPQEEASKIMAQASGEIAGQIVATQPGYAPLAQLTGIVVRELIEALVVNPDTRRLETEADLIGFFLMADAGFDPHDALTLWSRMAENPATSGEALQFLSSHPASYDRLETLRGLLPEAKLRYQQAVAPVSRPAKPGKTPRRQIGATRAGTTHPEATAPRDSTVPHNQTDDDSFAIE